MERFFALFSLAKEFIVDVYKTTADFFRDVFRPPTRVVLVNSKPWSSVFDYLLTKLGTAWLQLKGIVYFHFVPRRERVKGWITALVDTVSEVAHNAKAWLYAMFSRWHVDSPIPCV